ncbi:protein-tyrosine phosphatase-like protein [Podospora aff. communis PSN243]|uniref:Protein-tyrosine phosphatase-like protein n=1 Tax=Podospora aff. communis PSN243 TaxID=3040156 RepID=A0AAV9H293_9PEZI|nr:protein-tyrosine phosphatase-like protein [Podospora aff. communis PSN243]
MKSDASSDSSSVSRLSGENVFDSILNFRDIGKTINGYSGQRLVRDGLLFRSARPDEATQRDRILLKDFYGIKTVIDLRTKTEHMNAAKKRQADFQTFGKSNAAIAESIQIPGIRYHEIKLTGRRFELFLLSQLSVWNFVKFFVLFILGFRMRAIRILGREVMLPRGLVGLGLDTLDKSGPEIVQALNSYLEPGALPSLVHCTQGKDRTGIIVILVLLILGVPLDVIDYDYRLSDQALLADPEKESRLAEIREIGLTDNWGETSKVLVFRTVQHLESRYNGINGYLDGIGFDDTKRQRLRQILSY